MLSKLFFGETIVDTADLQTIIYHSSIGTFIVSEMTENPTTKYEKFCFCASLLINFGRASAVVSVAPINLAVLQIMQVFQI